MSNAGVDFREIKAKYLEDLEFKKEYDALQEDYDKALYMIDFFLANGRLYERVHRKPKG